MVSPKFATYFFVVLAKRRMDARTVEAGFNPPPKPLQPEADPPEALWEMCGYDGARTPLLRACLTT